MLSLLLPLCALAGAADYTVEDLGRASQRGLPEDTLELIADSLGPLDTDRVCTLLRYGVTPEWIRAHTNNEHPTPEEIATASAAGSIAPFLREYTDLSDAAWLQLIGADIVVRTPTRTVEGRLEGLASGELTLAATGGAEQISILDVSTVRRVDGTLILSDPERKREIPSALAVSPSPSRTTLVGRRVLWGGLGALALGALASVAANSEANNFQGNLESGDLGGAAFRLRTTAVLGAVGISSLVLGGGGTIGGVVVPGIGAKHDRDNRSDDPAPEPDPVQGDP